MSADRQARKNRNVRPSTQIARMHSRRWNHGITSAIIGAHVAPSTGKAGWSLPLTLALLAGQIPTVNASQRTTPFRRGVNGSSRLTY